MSPKDQAPHFIILGAMKSGTSALFHYLGQHPEIRTPDVRELHYFDQFHRRGWDWYQAQFPDLEPGQRTGEASPYYLFHPLAARRAAAELPRHTRFIVLLRDPISRALSHYHHMVQTGWERLPFDHAIDLERLRLQGEEEKLVTDERYDSHNHRKFSYLHRGLYLGQLQRWLSYFPAERFHIDTYEQFYANPHQGLRRVTDFLEVAPWLPEQFPAVNNGGAYGEMPPHAERILRQFFAPHNAELARFLGTDLPWMSEPQLAVAG